jgi:hypothetical protein
MVDQVGTACSQAYEFELTSMKDNLHQSWCIFCPSEIGFQSFDNIALELSEPAIGFLLIHLDFIHYDINISWVDFDCCQLPLPEKTGKARALDDCTILWDGSSLLMAMSTTCCRTI